MRFEEFVEELVAIDGVQATILSLRDGLVVASRSDPAFDENALAAITAAVFEITSRYFGEIGLGAVKDTIVETDRFSIQIMGLKEMVLIVVARKRMSVKEIRTQMRRIAGELDVVDA